MSLTNQTGSLDQLVSAHFTSPAICCDCLNQDRFGFFLKGPMEILGALSQFVNDLVRYVVEMQIGHSIHSSSNNGVLRYRSPKLHITVTMIFPLFSGRAAIFAAAAMFPPELIPARIPSSFANRRPYSNASSSLTSRTSSTIFKFRFPGTKPAPIPWILCRPGFTVSCFMVCVITGDAIGSTAIALKLGLRDLITSETPVIVPPVPTPATRKSTFPSVSCQISSAVVLR